MQPQKYQNFGDETEQPSQDIPIGVPVGQPVEMHNYQPQPHPQHQPAPHVIPMQLMQMAPPPPPPPPPLQSYSLIDPVLQPTTILPSFSAVHARLTSFLWWLRRTETPLIYGVLLFSASSILCAVACHSWWTPAWIRCTTAQGVGTTLWGSIKSALSLSDADTMITTPYIILQIGIK